MTFALSEHQSTAELVASVVDEVMTADLSHGVALTGGRVGTQVSLALLDACAEERQFRRNSVPRPLRLWFSDERFLPRGDAERNDTALLAHQHDSNTVTLESVMGPDSSQSAAAAALNYEQRLIAAGVPQVAIVSIGADGHIASIFPGHPLMNEDAAGVREIMDSPKPPPTRVTWTMPLFSQCQRILLLAAGPDKSDAVARILAGDQTLPATHLLGKTTTLHIA